MLRRCLNPKAKCYKNYGGRGIYVASEWMDFTAFDRDMGQRPEGKTLDRIDNDGPYAPWNCRWATPKEQRANSRKPKLVYLSYCRNGHEYTPENTYIPAGGNRQCRACQRVQWRRNYHLREQRNSAKPKTRREG